MKRLLLVLLCAVTAGFAFGVGDVEVRQSTGSVTVTDSADRTFSFDGHPDRVISAAPNITEIVFALGRGDTLVGRTDFCDYPPEVASIPSIGNLMEPNIEAIVELEPDVVIASSHFQHEVADTLAELGIIVLYYFTPNSFDGTYDTIASIGGLLGAADEADRIVAQMRSDVEDVLDTVAQAQRRPTVYYVVGFGQWGDFTAGGDTFIGQMLDMVGADNIASDLEGWNYSFEKIVEADPEIMICSQFWGTKESIESTDGYKDLSAVAEGRLYAFDSNTVDRQGPRLAEGLRALAQIVHPHLF